MRIFVGLNRQATPPIVVVDEETIIMSIMRGVSFEKFFQDCEVVIECSLGILQDYSDQILMLALKEKKGGPEDLLGKEKRRGDWN